MFFDFLKISGIFVLIIIVVIAICIITIRSIEYIEEIINKYREIFGLECFSYKEIDRFNWLFCNLKNEETN